MAEDETPNETPAGPPEETLEEKRERVLRRLGEILRAGPPDLSASSSGPVTAGGLPDLPTEAGEFDQDSAAELFGALRQFFELQRKEAGPEESERE